MCWLRLSRVFPFLLVLVLLLPLLHIEEVEEGRGAPMYLD